jgi:hypothetical protein
MAFCAVPPEVIVPGVFEQEQKAHWTRASPLALIKGVREAVDRQPPTATPDLRA